jgi:hypothetical protein
MNGQQTCPNLPTMPESQPWHKAPGAEFFESPRLLDPLVAKRLDAEAERFFVTGGR